MYVVLIGSFTGQVYTHNIMSGGQVFVMVSEASTSW